MHEEIDSGMHRRRFVKNLGSVSIMGLIAGCSAANSSSDEKRKKSSNVQLNVVGYSDCGMTRNTGTISFNATSETVLVNGMIPSVGGCNKLNHSIFTNDSKNKLILEISTQDVNRTEDCNKCDLSLEYEALLSFNGYYPSTVDVIHISPIASSAVATGQLNSSTTSK